jgi:hypothetical protein
MVMRSALYGALFVASAQGFQPTASFHGRAVAPKAMSSRCAPRVGSRSSMIMVCGGSRRGAAPWSGQRRGFTQGGWRQLITTHPCREQEAGPGRAPDVCSGQERLPVWEKRTLKLATRWQHGNLCTMCMRMSVQLCENGRNGPPLEEETVPPAPLTAWL